MSAQSYVSRRLTYLVALTIVTGAAGCADRSDTTDPRPQSLAFSSDTIPGTGQLSELQQRRAAWVARKINDYRYQLQISCFCGSEITRPVIIEVRAGVTATVTDVETGKPVTNKYLYPTITGLFDAAISERSKGGSVSVSYDRALGTPARLEVGTLANDAGVLYLVGGLTPTAAIVRRAR
jgi:hypothetical protein